MVRVFVSQACIDRWHGAGGIAIDGEVLRFHAVPQASLRISAGVYFERIDGAERDPHDIVGSVKSEQELTQMGADHYESSVVLGDYAYTVKPGFLAMSIGPEGAPMMLDAPRWGQLVGAMEALGTP